MLKGDGNRGVCDVLDSVSTSTKPALNRCRSLNTSSCLSPQNSNDQCQNLTSCQNNLTKRLHRHCTWTVQSYSPGGANVNPYLTHASLDPPRIHNPNGISTGSAAFAWLTIATDRPCKHLQCSRPSVLQHCWLTGLSDSKLDGCIVWNAHNIVLGEKALLIYIIPVCYVKKVGMERPTNIIISLHRGKNSNYY